MRPILLLGQGLRTAEFLDERSIHELASDFVARRNSAPRARLLLSLLMLEIWLSSYLPRATRIDSVAAGGDPLVRRGDADSQRSAEPAEARRVRGRSTLRPELWVLVENGSPTTPSP